jgi:uncharacterized protein Yka (UPF0111/DUF47 family)
MILTIINVIVVVAMFVGLISLFSMTTAFEELVVKFIEQNQEYYKTQKGLVDKQTNTIMELKKLMGSVNEMKRSLAKLQEVNGKLASIAPDVDKLASEVSRLISENNKLSSIAVKLNKKD